MHIFSVSKHDDADDYDDDDDDDDDDYYDYYSLSTTHPFGWSDLISSISIVLFFTTQTGWTYFLHQIWQKTHVY